MALYSRNEDRIRNRRLKFFNENVLPFLAYEYDVSEPNPSCYKAIDTPFGDLIIYPKGDKIQLQNGKWIGANIIVWLNNNVLKEKAQDYPKDIK